MCKWKEFDHKKKDEKKAEDNRDRIIRFKMQIKRSCQEKGERTGKKVS